MKTTTKHIFMISGILMAAGIVLTLIGISFGGWPGVSISRYGISSSSAQHEPFTLEKTEIDAFSNLEIQMDTYADIQILPSEDEHFYLEYLLASHAEKPDYYVTDDSFVFRQHSISYASLSLGSIHSDPINAYLALYIPVDCNLDQLKIDVESCDLQIENIQAKSTEIHDNYGDIETKDSKLGTFDISLESGDFTARNMTTEQFSMKSEYGTVVFQDFSCDKQASFRMESGDLSLDATKLGSLSCKSEYGNILLQLPEDPITYSYDLTTEYGSIHLPFNAPIGYYSDDEDEVVYRTNTETGKEYRISIQTESGDIRIQER
ncbi:MAG: DUF4097 domain-containing protein [Hespellia sp.]|nr:DUF4097 domain-containing protein [Hespellia sp.]